MVPAAAAVTELNVGDVWSVTVATTFAAGPVSPVVLAIELARRVMVSVLSSGAEKNTVTVRFPAPDSTTLVMLAALVSLKSSKPPVGFWSTVAASMSWFEVNTAVFAPSAGAGVVTVGPGVATTATVRANPVCDAALPITSLTVWFRQLPGVTGFCVVRVT